MKKVSGPQVVTTAEAAGESAATARFRRRSASSSGRRGRDLLALSVGVGLGVVHELMEAEVDEVVGPKGKHNADRTAKRHGHERRVDDAWAAGGCRSAGPRIRTADDEHELPVATYEYFADRDPLTRAVMDRMLAGVSTRKYARRWRAGRRGGRAGQHLDGQDARCRSCSSSGPGPRSGS